MDDVGRGRSHPLLRRVRLHPLSLGRRHLHPSLDITGFDLAEDTLVSLILDVVGISPITTESVHQVRSEEHTSELQSLMRISYAVFCLKQKTHTNPHNKHHT